MFESFHKFLPRAANVYGISREVKAAQVCHNFRELLDTLFTDPEMAREHISPGNFQDGTLTIDALSPAWAQEILMRKPQIIEALNRKAGLVIVKALRTRIKTESQL